MSAMLAAIMVLICGCAARTMPVAEAPQVLEPPHGVWSCPRWPIEDPLALPAQPEDVIRWKQVEDARKRLAFDACKQDISRWRDWARTQGYSP